MDLSMLLQSLENTSLQPELLKEDVIAYLESVKDTTRAGEEQVNLYFLLACGYAGTNAHRLAVHYFDLAFALTGDHFPHPELLTRTYLHALHTAVSQTGDSALVSNCREWSDRFDFPALGVLPELGSIYCQVKDYASAATLWQQHLESMPACANTGYALIHTLYHHLKRYEAAIAIYRRAPASLQQVACLQLLAGHCYKAVGEYGAAEKLYTAAIAASHTANTMPMCALAELNAENILDLTTAEYWYHQAINEKGSSHELIQAKISYLCFLVDQQRHTEAISLLLFMEQQLNYNYTNLSAADLNRVAWRLYVLNTRLDLAELFARRSLVLEPYSAPNSFTLVAILIYLKKWEELGPAVVHWLKLSDDATVRRDWSYYGIVFQEVMAQEKQKEFDALLNNQLSDVWLIVRYALNKTTVEGAPLPVPLPIRPMVEMIYQQLICPEESKVFPE